MTQRDFKQPVLLRDPSALSGASLISREDSDIQSTDGSISSQSVTPVPKPEEKPTLKEKILNELSNIGGRSTVHGIPSLSNPGVHFVVKIIWICCMIAGWSYLIVQVCKLFSAYNEYNVESTISTGFEIPTKFPGKSFLMSQLKMVNFKVVHEFFLGTKQSISAI